MVYIRTFLPLIISYLCSFYTQFVSYILTGEDGTTSLGTIAYGFKYTSYMVNGRIKYSGIVEVLDNVMQPVASCSAIGSPHVLLASES